MELTGIIKKKGSVQTFGSGFQKAELVLQTEEQYPQPILIEFLSDKTDLLNTISEGDKVKVGINIRGREWQSPDGEVKYFNSITGWRIEKVSGINNNSGTGSDDGSWVF
ncbi:DUF3127 domain-containing protein [Elizabethkingia anophelis]|uniref:DUF3127 domain-containing protein n=1 Tax=Elizabethkingia anophelis TaxID=1117645 RepID=UPI00136FCFD6|nr:DUF3127 domain-containing protein [Elizabethkingia anophelis]MYZ60765.1 DUF3127 domain-containing protein [Elizabethkingia anophelis]